MQAPRNWRMKVERYRLTGTESENGETSIVNRPQSLAKAKPQNEHEQPEFVKVTAA